MSTLKADTIQSTSGGAATLTKQHALKAHAQVEPQNSLQINSSFNISSLTDQSTGSTDFNMTSALSAATFSSFANNSESSQDKGVFSKAQSASVYRVNTRNASDSFTDRRVSTSQAGDLA